MEEELKFVLFHFRGFYLNDLWDFWLLNFLFNNRYYGLRLGLFWPILTYDMLGQKFHWSCSGLGHFKCKDTYEVSIFSVGGEVADILKLHCSIKFSRIERIIFKSSKSTQWLQFSHVKGKHTVGRCMGVFNLPRYLQDPLILWGYLRMASRHYLIGPWDTPIFSHNNY